MSIIETLMENDQTGVENIFFGVAVGIVTNIDDPDKRNRVKVKLINRDSSDYETDFIRVATPMVGKEWGMFFFPEVGDEVLVAFGNGDIVRPYVIGSLWNQNYKPPVDLDKKNMVREIKTKHGHEIIFHDEDNKDYIEIKTPKALTIQLNDEKETITIQDKKGKNILKIDSKNGQVEVVADKKVSLAAGNSKLELDGNGNAIRLESSKSIHVKSQQIIIESKGTLDLKTSGNMNIKANGQAMIKGAIVKVN